MNAHEIAHWLHSTYGGGFPEDVLAEKIERYGKEKYNKGIKKAYSTMKELQDNNLTILASKCKHVEQED